MALKTTQSAFEAMASTLTAAVIGARFAYESPDGNTFYGKIAAIEERKDGVHITLAGVIRDGSSVVLVLNPSESFYIEPSE